MHQAGQRCRRSDQVHRRTPCGTKGCTNTYTSPAWHLSCTPLTKAVLISTRLSYLDTRQLSAPSTLPCAISRRTFINNMSEAATGATSSNAPSFRTQTETGDSVTRLTLIFPAFFAICARW